MIAKFKEKQVHYFQKYSSSIIKVLIFITVKINAGKLHLTERCFFLFCSNGKLLQAHLLSLSNNIPQQRIRIIEKFTTEFWEVSQ